MNHSDLMPFGVHKGKPMANVPADYLDYISGQDWIGKHPEVKKYIEDNRQKIDKEVDRIGMVPVRFCRRKNKEAT